MHILAPLSEPTANKENVYVLTFLLDLLLCLWVLVAHGVQALPVNHQTYLKTSYCQCTLVDRSVNGSHHKVLTLTGSPGAPGRPLSPSTPT